MPEHHPDAPAAGLEKFNAHREDARHEDIARERAAYIAALGFPVLVIIGGLIGYFFSEQTHSIAGWTSTLLGIVMFGMGLTLQPVDFALVARRPLPVLFGVIAQYVIMPLLALVVVKILGLPAEIAAGVILVGCAPGGTSSNVVSYLARGDVALSVTMTSVSTLLAPIFTPLLTLWLAGQYMPVSAAAMAWSIVKVVLIPVVAGLIVRVLLKRIVEAILPVLPWISVIAIATIVAIVVSGSKASIAKAGLIVFIAVVLHNAGGYLLGYLTGRVLGYDAPVRRTMSVEVGMQNSGLAASLAAQYMTPLAALPAAVFSVWHNLSGAILAAFCRRADAQARQKTSAMNA